MTGKYALITICRDEVAPRFDMTAEALLAPLFPAEEGREAERKHLVLAHASSEELCDVITRSGVAVVVCGGIEEDYFHYLKWKRIDVINNVMVMAAAKYARLWYTAMPSTPRMTILPRCGRIAARLRSTARSRNGLSSTPASTQR